MNNDESVRNELEKILESGLETEWRERPVTSEDREKIVTRLQLIKDGDLTGKLKIAGFLERPYGNADDGVLEACETCMYFEIHRRHCNLPELEFPVKPEWSCRMWRI